MPKGRKVSFKTQYGKVSFLTRRPPSRGVKEGRPVLPKPRNRSSVMKYVKGHFRFIDEGDYFRVIPYRGYYKIYKRGVSE